MTDNTYVFETLNGQNVSFVADDGTGVDWVLVNGFYPRSGSYDLLAQFDYNNGSAIGLNLLIQAAPAPGFLFVSGQIENFQGSQGRDQVEGSAIANVILGDAANVAGGNDMLTAWGGNDTVYGMGGSDFLIGVEGDDLLFGDIDMATQWTGLAVAGNDTIAGGIVRKHAQRRRQPVRRPWQRHLLWRRGRQPDRRRQRL